MHRPAVSIMLDADWDMVDSPYADWLFSSLSTIPESTPEGWLLEREKRENNIPPMPFPMLAAPGHTAAPRSSETYHIHTSNDKQFITRNLPIFSLNTVLLI